MTNYQLKDGIYFVKGAYRGAILDTNSKNVFSINRKGTAIISGEIKSDEFWDKLVFMGMAEKTNGTANLPLLPKMPKPTLDFVWFEIITNDCNESCLHCYADSMPPTHRKAKGLPVFQESSDKIKLTYLEWCELIEKAYELGCRQCQFIGGEPLLYREGKKTVLDLAAYAVKLGYEFVEIFTNATLLNERKLKRIKELNINIAVSLYSHEAHVHDTITQTPGSFTKTTQAINKLKKLGIPTRIGFVAMKHNDHTISDTIVFIDNLGFPGSTPDPLRPKGRGDNVRLMPSPSTIIKYGVMKTPNFSVSRQMLEHYTTGHSCLAGKITITENGDILPCIFSRDQIMGNVKHDGGLENVILSSMIQQVWNTTKDNVLVCQDCEYRYVCFDCRPLSEAAAMGNADYLHAPYPRCSYNPYTGEWGKGLWRMDESGPYFDETYGDLISEVMYDVDIMVRPIGH